MPTDLQVLFNKCKNHIHAIYRIDFINKETKKVEKTEWRITSDKISPDSHFDFDKKTGEKLTHRFSEESLQEAMQAFFNYLKRYKKL